jgi:hypothetical protein
VLTFQERRAAREYQRQQLQEPQREPPSIFGALFVLALVYVIAMVAACIIRELR